MQRDFALRSMSDLWFLITLPYRILKFLLAALLKTGSDDVDNIH
jgi:hypothetical protein